MVRKLLLLLGFVMLATIVSAQPEPEVPLFTIPDNVSESISAVIDQSGYLKASNVDIEDVFGTSVAIDGDTVVIGAIYEDSDGGSPEDNSAEWAGAAYIFVREGDSWVQQAYLKAGNAEAQDGFGSAVAIDGDTVVISAMGESSNGSNPNDNSAPGAGAAYVFVRQGTTWVQQAYLKASNAEENDLFGYDVAISGDTIVIGAIGESSDGSSPNNNSVPGSGAAYVFIRQGVNWTQQAYLKAFNPDDYDRFGNAVDIDNNLIVVGAHREDSDGSSPNDNSASDAGAAYAFARQGSTWFSAGYLKASNAERLDNFGYSVAISNLTIAVGAIYEDSDGSSPDDNSMEGSGAAYIFTRSGASWNQAAYLKPSNTDYNDYFGHFIDIDGNLVIVSAEGEDSNGTSPANNSAPDAGGAYVFERQGTTWSEQAYLKASNTQPADRFGYRVGISGSTAIATAILEDSGSNNPEDNSVPESGAAYIFNIMPEFSSSPAPTSILAMLGTPETPATTTLEINNRATEGFLLNVDVTSLTAGYSIVGGLPIFGLSGAGEPVTVTVQCDSPGTTPATGTLVLQTNEFGSPSYTYDLTCAVQAMEIPPTETPVPTEIATETPIPTGTATEIPPVISLSPLDRIAPEADQVFAAGSDYITRFQWAANEDADWYHVLVATLDYSHIFVDAWYMAGSVCVDGICTTPDDIWVFGSGEFIWWMTYWSPEVGEDYINLYAESRFFLDIPEPGVLNGIVPVGEIDGANTVLTWQAEPNTIWYNVWAGSADYTTTVYSQWVYAPDMCADGVCSIEVGTLNPDAYEVWLQAWSPAGLGAWQLIMEFTVTE